MRHGRIRDSVEGGRSGLRHAALAVALSVVACSTDNGPNTYGDTYGPLPERKDGGTVTREDGGGAVDAATPGTDAGGPDGGASCAAGTLVVLSGGDTSLAGAVQDRGGAWKVTTLAGLTKSTPALLGTPSGFVGVVRGASDVAQVVGFDGAAWSAPSAIPSVATGTRPSLAPSASAATLHLAFLSPSFEHGYARRAQGTWSAPEALQPPQGAKSFGPSAPSVAEAAGDVVFAFDGDDGGLYTQTRSQAGTWAAASPVAGAGVTKSIPPVLVPLDGASDLLLLFADGSADKVIRHAVRASATKTWSPVQNTGALAFTPEAFRAARVSTSKVVVTYRGGDGRAYAMTGTLASGAFTWDAPVALLGATAAEGGPGVAPGVCGDEAVAVVPVAGATKLVRLRGGAWGAPEDVTGLAGPHVAVASR